MRERTLNLSGRHDHDGNRSARHTDKNGKSKQDRGWQWVLNGIG